MIYQLAKTSPLISGQVRWDLCVSYNGTQPEVSELHIVPLNDSINYNESNNRKTYNYPHEENVKYLYKQIEGDFYSISGLRDSKYYIYNQGDLEDPFDHTYERGLRRMRYTRYNRQFSFLCPVWISEHLDYSKLYFDVIISDANPTESKETAKPNYGTRIKLGETMQNYIYNYMVNSADSHGVSDELVSIKFDPVGAYITGLQVDCAKFSTMDVSYVIKNLIDRERPLMEFDNMILQLFNQKKIIAQQLINFNLVFNIADICPEWVAKQLENHDINVVVNIGYDDNILKLKDLYSNYTHIPAYDILTDNYIEDCNVLDYLSDDKCKDLLYVNKTTQPVFHWALLENPEIIYNLYNGFAPIYKSGNGYMRINGRYYNQCDIRQPKYDKKYNNLEWCKHYELHDQDTVEAVLNINSSNNTTIELGSKVCWLGSNKYDLTGMPIYIKDNETAQSVKYNIATCKTTKFYFQTPTDSTSIIKDKSNVNYLSIYCDRHNNGETLVINITIIASKNDLLTLAGLYNALKKYHINSDDYVAGFIHNMINLYESWIEPHRIEFYKSILPIKQQFDGGYSDIIKYVKKDLSFYSYVYRYTGKLIPYFIDIDDDVYYSKSYYYKQWGDIVESEWDIKEYNRLLKNGYTPEYPTFSKGSVNEDSYYSLIDCKFKSTCDSWYADHKWLGDITWVNDNRIWNLPPIIHIYKEVDDYMSKSHEEIMNELWQSLYDWFGEHIYSEEQMIQQRKWIEKYAYSLYNIELEFEYKSDSNIKDVVYDIKFSLK